MLSEHHLIDYVLGEVEAALGEAPVTEVEVAAFLKAEEACLLVLKAKPDFIHAAEDREKSLTEALERKKGNHDVDVENSN